MSKRIKVGPYILNLEINADTISKKYTTWKNKVSKLKGEEIGVATKGRSLFNMIENQGIVGRTVFDKDSPKGRETQLKTSGGGSDFIPSLDTFFDKLEFQPRDTNALKRIYAALLSNSEDSSPLNPRNMTFKGIKSYSRKPMIKNGKVLEDKKGDPRHRVTPQTVFGHYRTKEYVDYRNNIKQLNEFEGHESWYALTKPNKSSPPMWQALYAREVGNLNIKFSLILIIEDTIKALQNAKGSISDKTPIQIKGQGTSDAVYRGISEVKDFIDKAVVDSNYKTRMGNFNTRKAKDWFATTPIPLDNKNEENLMKRVMEAIDASYPIKITEVHLRVSPLMIRRMAELAGFQPPVKKTKKTNRIQKMNWMEVLVR